MSKRSNKEQKGESTNNKNTSSKFSPKQEKQDFQGNTAREGEGSLYDKIMRENLLELFLPLVAEELNFKFKNA